MKEIKMQIRRSQSLLTVTLVLMTGVVLGSPQDCKPVAGHACKTNHQSVDQIPAEPSTKTFESFAPAVKKAAPAVVRIVTGIRTDTIIDLAGKAENPLSRYLIGQLPRGTAGRLIECGLGSGVIVTEDGYILTNNHLVNGPKEVVVTLQDGREFSARVIGLDVESDIAVLKIDAHSLPTVALAESRKVQVGDLVLAIGHPFGVGQTVTHGIVSATDRGGMGIEDYENFIQTDAPINPGNSGGALVDVTGKLIGINTAILSKSGGNLGIGFAIPSDLAHKVMTDLVKYGHVVRGYLGLEAQNLTPELAKEFNLYLISGALVSAVVPRGPADKAGLEVGDVITRFDGKAVPDARQMRLSVADAKPGQTVPLELVRNGSVKTFRVAVGQAPNDDLLAKPDPISSEQDPGVLQGVTVGELNSQIRQRLKIPPNVLGAMVLEVHPFSVAAQAGLQPGDIIQSINRHEVRNAEEVLRLTQKAKEKRTLLRVWSPSGSHFLLVNESRPG